MKIKDFLLKVYKINFKNELIKRNVSSGYTEELSEDEGRLLVYIKECHFDWTGPVWELLKSSFHMLNSLVRGNLMDEIVFEEYIHKESGKLLYIYCSGNIKLIDHPAGIYMWYGKKLLRAPKDFPYPKNYEELLYKDGEKLLEFVREVEV